MTNRKVKKNKKNDLATNKPYKVEISKSDNAMFKFISNEDKASLRSSCDKERLRLFRIIVTYLIKHIDEGEPYYNSIGWLFGSMSRELDEKHIIKEETQNIFTAFHSYEVNSNKYFNLKDKDYHIKSNIKIDNGNANCTYMILETMFKWWSNNAPFMSWNLFTKYLCSFASKLPQTRCGHDYSAYKDKDNNSDDSFLIKTNCPCYVTEYYIKTALQNWECTINFYKAEKEYKRVM